MPLKKLFGRKRPSLAKILLNTEDYSLEEIEVAIAKAVAPGYNHKPSEIKELCDGVGLMEEWLTLLRSKAKAVKAGEFLDEKTFKGSFSKDFDNLLAERYFQGGTAGSLIENFYLRTFETFQNTSDFVAICPVKDERRDAYYDAVADFCEVLRKERKIFIGGARAYFKGIFRNKCREQTRSAMGEGNWRNNHYLDFIFKDLPKATRAKLVQPPDTLLGYDVDQLTRFNKKCLDLIYQKEIVGYKFAELAEIMNRSAESLRQDAVKCRRKLRKAFGSWRKD